jgi:LysR family transcriptional regulator for bpeEF and oprC
MQIELVQIFVQVIRNGSFTRAADVLKLPKSTVSKAVTRLEAETGTKLLIRTTRSQTLTAAGKAFYDSCAGPVQAIEDAQKSLSGNDSLLTGTLKITAPEDLGNEVIAPLCGKLTQKHPGLNFELIYSDQILDLVKDGFDLAIRIGNPKESGLKSRKVGEVKLVLVASREFSKSFGKISKPDALKDCPCLNLTGVKALWPLKSSGGETAQLRVSPRIISNHMTSLIQSARAGAGVALVPGFLARPHLEQGDLIRILPAWTSQGMPVHMLSPLSFAASARLRLVSDLLIDKIRAALVL